MIKYQYQTLSIHIAVLDATLNEEGNKGWRLMSIMPASGNHFKCVFEKIITPIRSHSLIPR